MPNPYFEFKHFTVYHDRCAMKVGTDGVLLGAWVDVTDSKKVLDVGTGSGLIALMVAQRNTRCIIDAIDVDSDAVVQTEINVRKSPFNQRINCKRISVQDLARNCNQKYDTIVSNPPFFAQSLKSPDSRRTMARHTDSLSVDELVRAASLLLSDNGYFSVIYPYGVKEIILGEAARAGLYPLRIMNILPTPISIPKRVMIEFGKTKTIARENELIIETERHIYSPEFRELAKDFYLKL